MLHETSPYYFPLQNASKHHKDWNSVHAMGTELFSSRIKTWAFLTTSAFLKDYRLILGQPQTVLGWSASTYLIRIESQVPCWVLRWFFWYSLSYSHRNSLLVSGIRALKPSHRHQVSRFNLGFQGPRFWHWVWQCSRVSARFSLGCALVHSESYCSSFPFQQDRSMLPLLFTDSVGTAVGV